MPRILVLVTILFVHVHAWGESARAVKVGVFDNKPIVFKNEAGKYSGVAVDVLESIASKENWKIQYQHGTWAALLVQLEKGDIDILVGMAYSDARSRKFHLTQETLVSNWGMIERRAGAKITSLLDLRNKHIALMRDSIHSKVFIEMMRKFGISYTPVLVDDYHSVMQSLDRGVADAGVINRIFSIINNQTYNTVSTSIIFNPVEVRYAASRSGDRLLVDIIDKHLLKQKNDPQSVYNKTLDHWLLKTTYQAPSIGFLWTILGVFGLLALVVGMNAILRRQVKRRTIDLRNQTRQLELEVAERRRAEEMMMRSRDFYLTLFDDFSALIWRSDVSTKCNYFNKTWLAFTGRKLEQELGDGWTEGVHPDDVEHVRRTYLTAFEAHEPFEMEYRLRYHDGSYRWITDVGRPYSDFEGKFSGYIGACFDIQDRKQAEEALRESETRFRAIFDQTFQFIGLLEPDGILLEANQTALDFGGFGRSDIVGRPFWEAPWWSVSEQTQKQLRDAITRAAEGEFVRYEVDVRGTDNQLATIDFSLKPVRDECGKVVLLIPEGRDITDRKRAESTLEHQSYHDMLTGLPNRWLLQDRLAQAMAFARRERRQGALLFLDLDRFKHINDTLGHIVGDQLLLAVTSRLWGAVREGDTLARLGGDDFILLLSNIKHTDEVIEVTERLINHLAQPFTLPGREVRVDACVGIALFPSDEADSETLLQHAEFAMYAAKQQGRGKYQFYTADTHAQASERFTIEHDLYRALENDELILQYQPQVSLENGDIVGVEALIRWLHPHNGLISPNKFIPVAEDTGLIVPLGEWVLRKAIEEFLYWHRQEFAPQRLAINLSVQQLFHAQTVPLLKQIILDSDIEPSVLELEITESSIMQDPDRAVETVRAIKQLGVSVAIDDFGTGYSSLAYLQRFPLDVLKIDQSFIRDINIDKNDETIVETIIAMARTLNLEVIAEGIETQAQADFLRERGCEYAQGYFYAYPMPAEVLEQFLTAKKRASLR